MTAGLFGDGMGAGRVRALLLAGGVFVVALWLRLHAIGHESLWLDETYTYQRAALPVMQTIEQSIARFHNPTYFVFMHFWIALGDDEFWLRLPSAIAGALTAATVLLTGYVVARERAGLVAGTLVALSPEQVYYGQEARMYAMLSLAAAVAMLGFTWLATHRAQACRPLFAVRRFWPAAPAPSRSAKLAWCACIVGTIATLYLHNTAVVFLGAAGAAVLVVAWFCGELKWRFLANAAVALSGVVAVWSIYLASLLRQTERLAGEFWERFPTWRRGAKIARQLYLLDAPAWSLVGVLVIAFALVGVYRLRRRLHLFLSLALLSVLGPLLLLLLSLHTPILGSRLLIWAPLPFFVLVGVGVSALRKPHFTAAFCLAIGLLTMPRLSRNYEFFDKERWRHVHAAILPRVGPETLIIAATRQEHVPLRYYFDRKTDPLPEIAIVENPDGPWHFEGDREAVLARMQAAKHVFLIDRKRGRRNRKLFDALVARGRLVSTVHWDRLRIDEIAIGTSRRLKKLKPMTAGTGHVSERKYKALRRER